MVKNSLDEFQDREDELMTLNDKILVAFGGDKGGVGDSAYMKWAYFIVTKNKPQDMANFTTYAMTKAPDFHENMRILHQSYTEDLITLQAEMFLGRRIHTLLVGDLNHISGMIGHQGSSASYPSAFTNVTLEHMAYHPFPHNLESCHVDDRDIATMKIDHALNCVKYPDEARRGGKYFNSIIGDSLFPIENTIIQQVVPSYLRLVTGLFKNAKINLLRILTKLMIRKCR